MNIRNIYLSCIGIDMKKFKRCPKCGDKMQYRKPMRLSNGNVMPAHYGHVYNLGDLFSDKVFMCHYSEEIKSEQ